MNHQNQTKNEQLRKINIIIIASFFFILFVFVVVTFYLYKDIVNQCTSEPLIYAAQKYQEDYGLEFVGTGKFISDEPLNSPIVHFNSTSVFFQKIPY